LSKRARQGGFIVVKENVVDPKTLEGGSPTAPLLPETSTVIFSSATMKPPCYPKNNRGNTNCIPPEKIESINHLPVVTHDEKLNSSSSWQES